MSIPDTRHPTPDTRYPTPDNINSMRRTLIILSLLFFPAWLIAQTEIRYDTASVSVRKFSPAAIKSYKENPVFQYDRIIEPPRSLWDRFWDWFWSKIAQLFSSKESWSLIRTILVILASAILLFFILKLLGMTNAGLFGKENKNDAPGYSITEEDIHSINFEAAIQEAVNEGNFRFAVRLLYLQSLKKMADLGLINWQLNKTNIAYLQELSGSKHYRHFTHLTVQFENNWYGDLPIEENEFRAVRDQFTAFNQQLH